MLDADSKLLLVHKSIAIDQVVEPIILIADNYSGRLNGSRQLGFYLLQECCLNSFTVNRD